MKEHVETLQALLSGALRAVGELEADPLFHRLLRVFSRMPSEDREVLLGVLEREVNLRLLGAQASEGPLSGLDMPRPNPNARLYVRTVEGESGAPYLSREELMHATLRAARAMHQTLGSTPDDSTWESAFVDALAQLDDAERAAVSWTNRRMLALLDRAQQRLDAAPAVVAARRARR